MSVRFQEGQIVAAGDLLAEIDPRPFQVQRAQAEGQVAPATSRRPAQRAGHDLGQSNGRLATTPTWHNAPVMVSIEELPDWERLLAAERHLQYLVPGTVLILGQLDGILTGVRQLRRTRPLEIEVVAGLRVPTLAEMARIKAWLLVTRHTVRDYLDTVVLCERLGEAGVTRAMGSFDEIYRQPTEASPLAEVAERLGAAAPRDLAEVDLRHYRALQDPWTEWAHVAARGRHWAAVTARVALEGDCR